MPEWSGGQGSGERRGPGWTTEDGSDRERRRQELRRQLSEDRQRWMGKGGEPPPMPHPEGQHRMSPDERRALRETLRQDAPRHGRERAPGQR
jgi:hypothetical protein